MSDLVGNPEDRFSRDEAHFWGQNISIDYHFLRGLGFPFPLGACDLLCHLIAAHPRFSISLLETFVLFILSNHFESEMYPLRVNYMYPINKLYHDEKTFFFLQM